MAVRSFGGSLRSSMLFRFVSAAIETLEMFLWYSRCWSGYGDVAGDWESCPLLGLILEWL